MGFIHDLNLWLTFEMGSDAVMTPIYTGLILIAIALLLSYFLKEEGQTMFQGKRSKVICLVLAASLVSIFGVYKLSMRLDERLAVAEQLRMIKIRGGASAVTLSRLAPSMGRLTEKFAWACAMEKDAWGCVKSRAYLAKASVLVH